MNIKLDPQIHWLLITIEMWIKGFVNKLNIQWPHRLTLNFHWFKLNGRWTRRGVDRRTKWWRCQWIHRFHCCCLLFNSISGRLFSLSATIQWSASSFIGPNEWKQGKSFFLSISAAIVTEKWLDDLQQQTLIKTFIIATSERGSLKAQIRRHNFYLSLPPLWPFKCCCCCHPSGQVFPLFEAFFWRKKNFAGPSWPPLGPAAQLTRRGKNNKYQKRRKGLMIPLRPHALAKNKLEIFTLFLLTGSGRRMLR